MADVFSILFLAVHLLAMNLAGAGPLVCIALRSSAPEVSRRLAWLSVAALVVGMILGAALIYVPPTEEMWNALGRFPTRAYWHAGSELVFSLVCMMAYAGTWRTLDRHRAWHAVLAIVSSTNLLYHFPPMMAIIGKLAGNPSWTLTPVIDRPAVRQLMLRSDILALSLHFVLASLAVAGIVALILLARQREPEWTEATMRHPTRISAGIALVATILQLPAGFWLLSTMSHVSRGALLGGSPLASLFFLVAIMLALLMIGRLLALTLGHVERHEVSRAAWMLACVILLMTASLRTSRNDQSLSAVNNSAAATGIPETDAR